MPCNFLRCFSSIIGPVRHRMQDSHFNEWLAHGGAKVYGVKAAEVAEGARGVVAVNHIKAGNSDWCTALGLA